MTAPAPSSAPVELSVVMPCLNEAETLARCVEKALLGFERAGIQGEVIVADNGSTDGSQELAARLGARVIPVPAKGYGSALRGGIEAARAEWVLMGDADDSYDFSESPRFLAGLRTGDDLVMGCRMPRGGGTIAPGAMPWKNRYLGNPSLSFLGRLFFRTPVQDFHCGLRAFTRTAFRRMSLKTTGMEFASEMILKASLLDLRISEVPITLHKDGRSRPPHLRPWRDGWRHLRFMLIYSPRWLFLYPGLLLGAGGGAAALYYFVSFERQASMTSALEGLAISAAAAVAGLQVVAIAFFTKVFAQSEGLAPRESKFVQLFRHFTLERGLIAGALLVLAGLWLLIAGIVAPPAETAGLVEPRAARNVIAATTLLVLGSEGIFSSFFMSVLGVRTVSRRPPDPEETGAS